MMLRMFAARAAFALLFSFLVCGAMSGQTLEEKRACLRLLEKRTYALTSGQWKTLVEAAREFLTASCPRVTRSLAPEEQQEANALLDQAIGLREMGRYDEAIPIARRCTVIKPDYANCFVEMGKTYEALAFVPSVTRLAIENHRRALEIGGYDMVNAAAVDYARNRLPWLEALLREQEEAAAVKNAPETRESLSGSGFYVSLEGHILTNLHVVRQCSSIAIDAGLPAKIVASSESEDLALLRVERKPEVVATFRFPPSLRSGEQILVFGFALPGLLSDEGNVSTGTISALSGLANDPRFIQISAPVQPGNSGGPLLDLSGSVVGVIVAKLDAVQVARVTGDIPQNVNFAVRLSRVLAFLMDAEVAFRKTTSPPRKLSTEAVASLARRLTVRIDCTN